MKAHTCTLTTTTVNGSIPPPCEACQETFQVQPQKEFKVQAETVEYFPNPEVESNMVVFRNKEGRPVMYAPTTMFEMLRKKKP